MVGRSVGRSVGMEEKRRKCWDGNSSSSKVSITGVSESGDGSARTSLSLSGRRWRSLGRRPLDERRTAIVGLLSVDDLGRRSGVSIESWDRRWRRLDGRRKARARGRLQGNWYRTGTSRSDVRHREYDAMHDAGQVALLCIVGRRWSGGTRP